MLRIAVVGAGWYGCHLTASLTALGLEVDLYEASDSLLGEASGNNQFRLHMGFHYARSHRTRLQSRDGYARFTERYPLLSQAVESNVYAVAARDSLIDFPTYKLIMSSAGIEFREGQGRDQKALRIGNISGFLFCDERVVLTGAARSYFARRLEPHLRLSQRVTQIQETDEAIEVEGRAYDYMIDTTWGHLTPPEIPCFYEPTLLLYYRSKGPQPAVTLVDGPLASVYPTEDPSLFTLSSVPHTPLGRFDNSAAAVDARDRVTADLVQRKRSAMERQIRRYVLDFQDRFVFEGIQLAVKTKPTGASDDRSCWVKRRGRRFSVLSGKIDTIFFAAQVIIAELEAVIEQRGAQPQQAVPSIRGLRPMPSPDLTQLAGLG